MKFLDLAARLPRQMGGFRGEAIHGGVWQFRVTQTVAAIEAVHQAEQQLKQRRIALVFGDAVPYQDRERR